MNNKENDYEIAEKHGFEIGEKVLWLTDNNKWIFGKLFYTIEGEPVIKYYGGKRMFLEALITWTRIKKYKNK